MLLDEGCNLGCVRTMYRLLKTHGGWTERRYQRRHSAYAKPELLAAAPNQVWSWNITKLKGPAKWSYFHLYVILDIFSRLEKHKLAGQILSVVNDLLTQQGLLLKTGTVVDATLIPAPSSTKNKDRARDPQMHSSKKGQQMYFGMKAHIGADAESGLVHTVRTTSGNVHDVTQGNSLVDGQESVACGDAGYQGIEKRPDAKAGLTWNIVMRPGKRKLLNKDDPADALIDQAEKLKAGIRAKVEHAFRVIKRQFGYVKVRDRGLKKNTAQLLPLSALSNLLIVRGKLMGTQA